MPGQAYPQRSPWTGRPQPGRDNKSKMQPGATPGAAADPRQEALARIAGVNPMGQQMGAPGMAQKLMPPPPGPPTLPPPGLSPVKLPPGTPPPGGGATETQQQGLETPPPDDGTTPPPGTTPPGTPPGTAPGTPPTATPTPTTTPNAYAQQAQGIQGSWEGQADQTWDAAQAEALAQIDQETAHQQWLLAEQMGARGFGASTQLTSGLGSLGAGALTAKSRAITDLAMKRQMETDARNTSLLQNLFQFADAEDKNEISQFLAEIQARQEQHDWQLGMIGVKTTAEDLGTEVMEAGEIAEWEETKSTPKTRQESWERQGLGYFKNQWQSYGKEYREDENGQIWVFNESSGDWEPQD